MGKENDIRALLNNGKLLNMAKLVYLADKSRENLLKLLSIMINSRVLVPVNIVMSKADEKQFLNSRAGDIVSTKSEMRMNPDILEDNKGRSFFPCFSQNSEIPNTYRLSFIETDMMDCIEIARKYKDISGIVLDGFTKPFQIPMELVETIAALPPIEETNANENVTMEMSE